MRVGSGFGLNKLGRVPFYLIPNAFCFAEGRFIKEWPNSAVNGYN